MINRFFSKTLFTASLASLALLATPLSSAHATPDSPPPHSVPMKHLIPAQHREPPHSPPPPPQHSEHHEGKHHHKRPHKEHHHHSGHHGGHNSVSEEVNVGVDVSEEVSDTEIEESSDSSDYSESDDDSSESSASSSAPLIVVAPHPMYMRPQDAGMPPTYPYPIPGYTAYTPGYGYTTAPVRIPYNYY